MRNEGSVTLFAVSDHKDSVLNNTTTLALFCSSSHFVCLKLNSTQIKAVWNYERGPFLLSSSDGKIMRVRQTLSPERQSLQLFCRDKQHIQSLHSCPVWLSAAALIGISGVYLQGLIRESQAPGDNMWCFVWGIKPNNCGMREESPLSLEGLFKST